jgi:hypothetical protein
MPLRRFQQQAYIHRTIAERKKEDRAAKKLRVNTALTSRSRAQVEQEVDQSSRMIGSLTQRAGQGQLPGTIEEDEEAEDWFGE